MHRLLRVPHPPPLASCDHRRISHCPSKQTLLTPLPASRHATGMRQPNPFGPQALPRHQPLRAAIDTTEMRAVGPNSRAQPARFASAATHTSSTNVKAALSGTDRRPFATEGQTGGSSQRRAPPSAQTGSAPRDAESLATPPATSALAAVARTTGLRDALEQRRRKTLTPYNPEAWETLLASSGLVTKYPHISEALRFGFRAAMPSIQSTYTPPNSPSVHEHKVVLEQMFTKELSLGRYLGPYTRIEIESVLGPFQSSPLSVIPKPGRPGKFRLIQNLSFPHNHSDVASINARINSDSFPCTYGTFDIVSHLIWHLPPGSQAAIRDVSEAYRTVPLAPSEWHGLVVQMLDGHFAVDTCLCFGFGPSGGIYGALAGAATDIFRAKGIGPISRWVDDHIFFRIRREYLKEFNGNREQTAMAIQCNGEAQSLGGRVWYQGNPLPNGHQTEFDDDHSFPVADLSASSVRSEEDSKFTYNFDDINKISDALGIPWEASKDVNFTSSVTYLGFVWDLTTRTVTLSEPKRAKYLLAIMDWQKSRTHSLNEVQKLYGKLLHASHVIPAGRAYLTSLEAMLTIFGNNPFKPHTPPRHTPEDLAWWHEKLSSPPIPFSIPGPSPVHDFAAFSDASSGVGIAVIIQGRCFAWELLQGWKSNNRDIGWAESVGFELLIRHILHDGASGIHFKVFGDNKGVIKGWKNGRSCNRPTNDTFKRIHEILSRADCSVVTEYVPSSCNPADGPSRGLHPPSHLKLPTLPIPHALQPFIRNATSGRSPPLLSSSPSQPAEQSFPSEASSAQPPRLTKHQRIAATSASPQHSN